MLKFGSGMAAAEALSFDKNLKSRSFNCYAVELLDIGGRRENNWCKLTGV